MMKNQHQYELFLAQPRGYLAFLSAVSQNKKADAELRKQAQALSTMIENILLILAPITLTTGSVSQIVPKEEEQNENKSSQS